MLSIEDLTLISAPGISIYNETLLTITAHCYVITARPQFRHGMDIGHWMAANRLQMNPAKNELLWAGTKHNASLLGCHALTLLGSDNVTPSNHIHVLGVTTSSDLSLDQHVLKVCAAGFY